MVRQRRNKQPQASPQAARDTVSSTTDMANDQNPDATGVRVGGASSGRTQWILLAIASGACAAFNGVFAKLTTTELTSKLSKAIANGIGLSSHENIVEVAVRGMFFALNLTFNGIMWTLFTKALAKGTSTTQVSIINTSTNFMLTALLGLFIFAESLPPLWWAGASLLVVGNVIVGRKDETKDEAEAAVAATVPVPVPEYRDEPGDEDEAIPLTKSGDDEDVADLGDLSRT